MKKLFDYILEVKGDLIDDQWIQDEKPVQTKDGRQVIITKINYEEVPNIIVGKVKLGTDFFDYEWEDSAICVKALDKYGNPKKPSDSDNLVKAS